MNVTEFVLLWAIADGKSKLRADKMTDGWCSLSGIFRKPFFDAIKRLKKTANGKAINSYIFNRATNLDGHYVLNTIKFLLKENLFKNTPNKEGDSYYLVSGSNSTAVTTDTSDTESTS